MDVMRYIHKPEYILTASDWLQLGQNHDLHKAAGQCCYLHSIRGKRQWVRLEVVRGVVRQRLHIYTPGGRGSASSLESFLNYESGMKEAQIEKLVTHSKVEYACEEVVNCFTTEDWLAKEAEAITYWNEYYPGMFSWDPTEFKPDKSGKRSGKMELLYEFLKQQCGGEDKYAEYVLSCLALKFANPYRLMTNILLWSSSEGTGKSMLIDLVAQTFGDKFSTTTQGLNDPFSASLSPSAIWGVHEATQLSPRLHGKLRDRVTSERILVNVKYEIQREYINFVWFLLATNPSANKKSHFKVEAQARRYRMFMSRGVPAEFIPKLKQAGMLKEDQGFSEDTQQVLLQLAAQYYDPKFVVGGTEQEAKALSDPIAWAMHVRESKAVLNTARLSPHMGVALAYMASDDVKQRILGLRDALPKRWRIGEFLKAYGLNQDDKMSNVQIGAFAKILQACSTEAGITVRMKRGNRAYEADWDQFEEWLQNFEVQEIVQKGLAKETVTNWKGEEVYLPKYDKRTRDAWSNMNNRCNDKEHRSYEFYGGAGVKVCERWHKDNPSGWWHFVADMGVKPEDGTNKMQLHRLGDSGDYEPENCAWMDEESAAEEAAEYRSQIVGLRARSEPQKLG